LFRAGSVLDTRHFKHDTLFINLVYQERFSNPAATDYGHHFCFSGLERFAQYPLLFFPTYQ
jgi:hypothetical protein